MFLIEMKVLVAVSILTRLFDCASVERRTTIDEDRDWGNRSDFIQWNHDPATVNDSSPGFYPPGAEQQGGGAAQVHREEMAQPDQTNSETARIRHLRQKVRLKEPGEDPLRESTDSYESSSADNILINMDYHNDKPDVETSNNPVSKRSSSKPYRIVASGSRKPTLLAAARLRSTVSSTTSRTNPVTLGVSNDIRTDQSKRVEFEKWNAVMQTTETSSAPRLVNPMYVISYDESTSPVSAAIPSEIGQLDAEVAAPDGAYDSAEGNWLDDPTTYGDSMQTKPNLDIVTKFLRIVESQHTLGDNCTAGTDFNLGDGVVDRYAQERFRLEAEVAVNWANWLTRVWKYAHRSVLESEYLLQANLYWMLEMDEDIFAAGNCYDRLQYKDYDLFCPFAYRLPDGAMLAKDLSVEYKYLANTSEWFYNARKNAERVIRNMTSLTKGTVTSRTTTACTPGTFVTLGTAKKAIIPFLFCFFNISTFNDSVAVC